MSALDVADALGLTPTLVHEGGTDGVVMMLDDGRVLKVTSSLNEAALAMAVMAVPDARRPDGVPRIDSVHACRPDELDGYPSRTFAILHEDLADLPVAGERRWRRALHLIDIGLRNGDRDTFAVGVDHWPGPEMDGLLTSLFWYHDALGTTVLDVQADNVGVSATGGVGMRDLGRCVVPDRVLALLDEVPFLDDLPRMSPW